MKRRSYAQLQVRYGGQFIARLNGRVVASAKTSKTLFAKIRKWIGKRELLIEYIEPKGAICIYFYEVSTQRETHQVRPHS